MQAKGRIHVVSSVLLTAAMGCLAVGGLAPAAVLLLPMITELFLSAYHDRITPTLAGVLCAVGCWLLLPHWLAPVSAVCCMAPSVMGWMTTGADARQRGAQWCRLSAALALIVLVTVAGHYDGHTAEGLAQSLADRIAAWPGGKALLYQLYAMGRLPFTPSAIELALMQHSGAAGMTSSVQHQLLQTLRFGVAEYLNANMVPLLITWAVLNGVIGCALRNALGGKRQAWRELPKLEEWHTPWSWTMPLLLLLLPSLIGLLAGGGWLGIFAQMCRTLAKLAMQVQGACLLYYMLLKQKPGVILIVLILLFFGYLPGALLVLGVADHIFDFRRLRPIPGEDDDTYD